MSRLTDLIRTAKQLDPQLGEDLEAEFEPLQERLPFGLNFERHQPEAVELPGRKILLGSKVRVLPQRGSTDRGDRRLWVVDELHRDGNGVKVAELSLLRAAAPEQTTVAVDELLLVAEFRDPIYPGLVSTGRVERGGDKPFHTVINGENYHVLETLKFTHRGRVDAIYIDPPYNTGARDWKYNNDYVEGDDLYRHSKWLAFMERRLQLAKELLDPEDSVLIVTIDEKEVHRLGLLLQQVFPAAGIQMVSSVINPKGTGRANEFSRVDEYVFFVTIGNALLQRGSSDMLTDRNYSAETEVRWRGLARTGRKGLRGNNPGSWYPIFISDETLQIHSIGDTVPAGVADESIALPPGTFAAWPPSTNGNEYSWSVVPATLRDLWVRGAVKLGRVDQGRNSIPLYYLSSNILEKVDEGAIQVLGRGDQGELLVAFTAGEKSAAPKTVWHRTSHDAGSHGTNVLRALMPDRQFPFPKSLYAVEDALRFFVKDKPDAIVVDFFAGSGTTAHAVMRLNRQDGGRRQSLLVTNNEVSANEQTALRKRGQRAGDLEWEALGICEFITKPRVTAAITGATPTGAPIDGEYRFTDEFPMSEGFEENAEYFTLTYESVWKITQNRAFAAIAPLLWLRAGANGRQIEGVPNGWDVAEAYGVLADLDKSGGFVEAVLASTTVRIIFIITDDDRRFQMVCDALRHVETVRLYSSYFQDFQINRGDVS